VAEPRLRKRLADTYHDLPFANLIHPDTSFGRSQKQRLESSKGLVLGAGTRFMNSICIESFVVISLNCTIGHDVELGSYVSIMPGVNISGNVVLDEGCYIGSGAVVLQGQPNDKLSLGRYTIVGAGAVVTKSHNDEQVLVGIPAKALKIDL
jgi:UDP-3-O-[3-hydroxymyristoyl] glucosamine N-acyltransferase